MRRPAPFYPFLRTQARRILSRRDFCFSENAAAKASVLLASGTENKRHDKGKNDRRADARARRGQSARKGTEKPFLRAANGAVRQKISESANGDGSARARKIHEILIDAQPLQDDARQHEIDEDLSRSPIGEIDDELRNGADEPAHRKCLRKHKKYVQIFRKHSLDLPIQRTFSMLTAWQIQGMLSPCPEETVDSSAPVAAKSTRLISRRFNLS